VTPASSAHGIGSESEPGKRRLRILLITQWFDPEPTFKGLLFAKELQRLGHDVRVVTGFPNYPGGKLYEGYRLRIFQRETVDGIPVLRVPLYPSHDGSGSRRILNYLSFAVAATVGVLVTKRPDVAYVYHPPASVGVPAIVLKVVKGVPFVYDIQDLWPDTLLATGMVTNPRVLSLVGRVMNAVYRRAGRIVVLSPGFREALVARSVYRGRIDVIPNWADEQQIDVSRPSSERAIELGFDHRFTVTFAGNIGKGQGLEVILDAAHDLIEKPIRFLVIGAGLELKNLRKSAQERGLHNVEFLPRRPLSQIGELLALSDALLVHLRDDPLFSITIPSKTQAYMMAGRPILMGVRGDAARLVAESGSGLCFDPQRGDQLAAAVEALVEMSESDRAQMGAAGRAYYEERLSLRVGAQRFAAILEVASLLKPHVLAVKRGGDIVASLLLIALLSIPMAVIALVVRSKLGAPVLFRQTRPGTDGKPFRMIKFRTMTDERDEAGRLRPDGHRLTRLGAILRSTSLDELPELFNVLRGEMSLVGPRPLLTRYTKYFSPQEEVRMIVKPGITGWAQIHGRNTASWDARLALDVWYVRHQTVGLDLKILASTIGRVFRRSGVVVDPESQMLNLDDERRGRAGQT
jgi:lipopolysaccharide/colanic/teichoic acid biosynthesis glycosyltransferase